MMMEPRRKSIPGPMGLNHHSKKSTHIVPQPPKPTPRTRTPPKEIVTVHSSKPKAEHKHIPSETLQIYQGSINNLSVIDTGKDIMFCKYTEDVYNIAAGFTNGTIDLYDSQNGKRTHVLMDDETLKSPGPVTGITHRPVSSANPVSETILASYVNGSIKCWKYGYDHCLYTIREKRQSLGLSYHPRQSKFITYGDDAKLNMYDEEAQTQERAFYSSQRKDVMDGHVSRIFACAFHTRSNHELISGGWDNAVMCWDDRQPYATRSISDVHMCGEGLDFDKAGKTIVTCAWQEKDTIQLWDYGSCKLIDSITPDSYNCKLYCGKFVPNTTMVLCGGSDGNILRLVDTESKITLCSIRNNPGGIYSFDLGTIRRKAKKNSEEQSNKTINETLQNIPRVAFVSGKRIQVIDFG